MTVRWKGGLAFEAEPLSGARFVMDAPLDDGGNDLGPSPVEALLSAAAACSGMDVVTILNKKRQCVTDYRLEIEWTRDPPGQYPRPVKSVVIRHVLSGDDLDPEAVQRAVELSDDKYCTVIATLRFGPAVCSEFRIEP